MAREYPSKEMTKKLKSGAFTKKAKEHKKSVKAYANQIVAQYKDQKWKEAKNPREALKTYRQAVLAKVFERIASKK